MKHRLQTHHVQRLCTLSFVKNLRWQRIVIDTQKYGSDDVPLV